LELEEQEHLGLDIVLELGKELIQFLVHVVLKDVT
jgi:hypothetical protein